jgi:type II secretory pathway predicted ATPase ExeA
MKDLLRQAGYSQRQLAAHLGISPAAVNLLLNRGAWPTRDRAAIRDKLLHILAGQGVRSFPPDVAQAALEALAALPPKPKNPQPQEDIHMLRKQALLPKTRQAFRIHGDPFGGECRSVEDVYLDDNTRYVREAIYMTAKHGGMLAVVGESGSGKSTLRRDFLDRVKRESLPIVAVEPYIISMDDDRRGKPLRADHIAEAVIYTLAPTRRVPRSQESRYRLLHKVLKESARAGNRHVLVIEEAHDLHGQTLKHLKRFYELEDGFDRLLSIILFGQTELKANLGETNSEVREVVQRMELVELHPLHEPEGYLRHRLERVGLDYDKLLAPDAVDALRSKHSGPAPRERGRAAESVSLLYPLAVGNTLTAAFNLAAELGLPKVSGDIIRRV